MASNKRSIDELSDVGNAEENSDIKISVDESIAEQNFQQGLLSEVDMGISEYISHHSAIFGIFKQRISDFIVNEIATDGSVTRLTNFNCPHYECKSTSDEVLSMAWITQLTELSDEKTIHEVLLEVSDDKAERTAVHEAIRKSFPRLESSTVEINSCRMIKVVRANSKASKRRDAWPKDRPDYCQFVLYKENVDTMEAVGTIARCLNLRVSLFSYAGTKDRRAKTSQLVTVYRITAERLLTVNKQLKNIKVGNFKYCENPLRLGELKGNRFQVVLRKINVSYADLKEALKSLEDIGFLNYFGTQRFGTTSVPTHHIGRLQALKFACTEFGLELSASNLELKNYYNVYSFCIKLLKRELLKGNWKNAIDLILKPRSSSENDRIDKARQVWHSTHNADEALNHLGYRQCVEKHLLIGLKKSGQNDYLGALNAIPRNSRLLYLHSFQSYVWNKIVSKRVKQFGLKLLPGDLVLQTTENITIEENVAADIEVSSMSDAIKEGNNSKQIIPVAVTEDIINQYSIYDWVLPTPGHSILYPDNVCKEWYMDILAENGLDHNSFNSSRQRELWLPGTYRRVIVRPDNLEWETAKYSNQTIDFSLSDWDMLEQKTLPTEHEHDGLNTALKVSFSLPPSAYATMAVRELLKMDTTPSYQASLNNLNQ